MIGGKTPLAEEYAKLFLDAVPALQTSDMLSTEELLDLATNTLEVPASTLYYLRA